MRKRTIAIAVAALVAIVAALPVLAATPKFNGTVGPGLHDLDAKKPTKAGKTTIVVSDKSSDSQLPPEGPERERQDERPGDRVEDLHGHAQEGEVHVPLRPSSVVDEGLLHDQSDVGRGSPRPV